MDYEKAYNEAIKRAKAIIEVAEKEEEVYKSAITIFPELRESKDEKIRQKFIKLVKMSNEVGGFALHKWEADEMLAWLEKQGKQNPANKIEPKFHEGEWIISNDKKSTYQVIEVKRGIYVIRDNVDNHEYHIGIEECEKSGRLFTIQDAKDGDVLVFKNNIGGIIICKSPSDYDTRSYCRLIRDNLINKEESGWDSTLLVPATKEQRDLLFSKMKEVGYEWNSEKKELKKLSQRMISAEVKEALYDKPTDEEMKELLRTEYEKGRADTIAEMKKDWSEDDEKRLQSCINILKAKSLMGKVDTANTMWLKSLKQRIGG